MGKPYDQPFNSNIKQYKEIRKLTIQYVEDYTTACLLDYNYITKVITDS